MDWNVKLYIQTAAVRFGAGLKLTSPLYSTSYTGAAFMLLSWQESVELEGGGKEKKIDLLS